MVVKAPPWNSNADRQRTIKREVIQHEGVTYTVGRYPEGDYSIFADPPNDPEGRREAYEMSPDQQSFQELCAATGHTEEFNTLCFAICVGYNLVMEGDEPGGDPAAEKVLYKDGRYSTRPLKERLQSRWMKPNPNNSNTNWDIIIWSRNSASKMTMDYLCSKGGFDPYSNCRL